VKVQPASTAALVTTLTASGLTEEPQTPATELSKPPAPLEVVPEVEFSREEKRKAAQAMATPKPVSPTNVSPTAPLAASTTNENESFPL
jgi:hypothetical protein